MATVSDIALPVHILRSHVWRMIILCENFRLLFGQVLTRRKSLGNVCEMSLVSGRYDRHLLYSYRAPFASRCKRLVSSSVLILRVFFAFLRVSLVRPCKTSTLHTTRNCTSCWAEIWGGRGTHSRASDRDGSFRRSQQFKKNVTGYLAHLY